MNGSGTYALVIDLRIGICLRIGKLAIHNFVPGYYVYTGSALGGLSGRLRHHLKLEKRLHWHIDYLLQEAEITQIWLALGKCRLECIWNAIVNDLPEAISSISGFGASDCHCSSHLTYFPTIPPFSIFEQRLRQRKLPKVYKVDLAK